MAQIENQQSWSFFMLQL